MSICLTLEALWPFSADEAAWLRTVERSLWNHLHFTEAHSEFSHFCRSNHYLSNISGLYCLHSFLEGAGLERGGNTIARHWSVRFNHRCMRMRPGRGIYRVPCAGNAALCPAIPRGTVWRR